MSEHGGLRELPSPSGGQLCLVGHNELQQLDRRIVRCNHYFRPRPLREDWDNGWPILHGPEGVSTTVHVKLY